MKLKDKVTEWWFRSKFVKGALAGIGAIVAGGAIMLGGVMIGYPAISQLVGLAVAQSSTLWNNVIDAAKGDSQTNGILGTSTYLFNGVSFDRVRGTGGSMNVAIVGAITPADAFANPTTATTVWNLNGVFNGTTWDRQREPTADALAVTGLTAAANQAFNGATWDRIRTATADALASTGIQMVNSGLFNGTTFDRWDGVSATNNTETTTVGVARIAPVGTWSVTNTANAGTPSASKAAGGGTVRHVATCVSVNVGAAATAQPVVQVNLRDGATGAGTIIRSWQLAAPANDSATVDLCGLNMTGSANTAMTIEFAAATAANTQASVNLSGYSTP